jgi:Lipocalin-like domain
MKLLALSLALCIPAAIAGDTAADLQKKFVGPWKLISIVGPPAPNQQPVNGTPFGIIMYDNTGHMAVQIVRGDRPLFANGAAKATDKERAQAYSTYTAYYGTYTFEPENQIVIHHLEGSITPGQIGQDNIRYFELKGNRLTLSVANDGKGGRIPFKETTRHLTWEKIPAK